MGQTAFFLQKNPFFIWSSFLLYPVHALQYFPPSSRFFCISSPAAGKSSDPAHRPSFYSADFIVFIPSQISYAAPFFLLFMPQDQRLVLLSLKSRFGRRDQKFCMSDHRIWLFLGIILTKRDKVDVLCI